MMESERLRESDACRSDRVNRERWRESGASFGAKERSKQVTRKQQGSRQKNGGYSTRLTTNKLMYNAEEESPSRRREVSTRVARR